jgi:hypothetical protein
VNFFFRPKIESVPFWLVFVRDILQHCYSFDKSCASIRGKPS